MWVSLGQRLPMHCIAQWRIANLFTRLPLRGAASALFAHSENSPTSHFIPQTTVCGIPETLLLDEFMRRQKNLQAAEQTSHATVCFRSVNSPEPSVRRRQLCAACEPRNVPFQQGANPVDKPATTVLFLRGKPR